MALAKYFSKDLLAINRLVNTDQSILENRLLSSVITIAFDENAVSTCEGNCGLDLIIRLLSRLYPTLKFIDLSKKNEEKKDKLIIIAKGINSNIEIANDGSDEDIFIVAGHSETGIQSKGAVIYLGSDNWISKYSTSRVQSFGTSDNPFGCGISACIAASNVFRYIFSAFLNSVTFDNEFEMSVFSLNEATIKNNPPLGKISFNDVIIAGIGAIGNGTVWALSNLHQLEGDIQLVDNETVSLSNLQRYVLFNENDEKRIKISMNKNLKI